MHELNFNKNLTLEEKHKIYNAVDRSQEKKLCSNCKFILEEILMDHNNMINELDAILEDLDFKKQEILDHIITQLDSKLAKIHESLDNIAQIKNIKDNFEYKEKELSSKIKIINQVITNLNNTIINLVKYIDTPKSISFRKEPDPTPKIVSNELREIVDNLNTNNFNT